MNGVRSPALAEHAIHLDQLSPRGIATGQLTQLNLKAGDPLAVVEAMKMENVLRAERDGVVKKVNAKPGDSLAVDAVIMEFA